MLRSPRSRNLMSILDGDEPMMPQASGIRRLSMLSEDGNKKITKWNPKRFEDIELPAGIGEGPPEGVMPRGNPNGRGISMDLPPGTARPTGSAATIDEIGARSEMPANTLRSKNEKTFGGRVKSGAGRAWRDFKTGPNSGGVGGLLMSMLGGALGEGFDPNTHAENEKQEAITKLMTRAQREIGLEDQQAEQAKQGMQIAKIGQDVMDARNKPFLDSITADDVVDEGERQEAARRGIDLNEYDKREFGTTWVNGRPYAAPKKGVPNYRRNPSLPDQIEDVPVDTTISAGGKDVTLPLKPGQAASTIVGVEQANAQRIQRAAEFVAEQERKVTDQQFEDEGDFAKEARSYEQRILKARGQKSKAEAALRQLQQTRQELIDQGYQGTEQVANVDKQIATMSGDIAEAEELMKERRPVKRVRKTPAKGKGKYSQSDIDRVLRQ